MHNPLTDPLSDPMDPLTHDEQRHLEGYAAALQDLLFKVTGENYCSKIYDPMTCEPTVMHSYAFDMKDGGRHHYVKDYRSIEEIKDILMDETITAIRKGQK